ncbi:hypothetical protein [Thalassovita taeanensis]|uniref:Uncharacterized protein n=1 Tax=Thalassovita taeanensis TaxID=657014 RepID=A0A1H9FQX7_9RHOB|nr:hypothetical protein [Thalassovita taeanensis]SEQ40307.1 hypothetical protein SAMN04488092_106182 [Thalassovita taeanensis]
MTLQNRVLPTGEIVAHPARGSLTGNRGILHRADLTLGTARWKHPHWVCCALEFRGRHRLPMPPNAWTALFFLDESVALAAGHRPCHQCRHADAKRFRAAWQAAHGPVTSTKDIDRALHPARVTRARQQLRHSAPAETLPDGSLILTDAPYLIWQDRALRYSPAGYTAAAPRPTGPVTVLTPAPLVATLVQGYGPALHPTARALLD